MNKEALGRRIVEKARVVIKMTQPDPEDNATAAASGWKDRDTEAAALGCHDDGQRE